MYVCREYKEGKVIGRTVTLYAASVRIVMQQSPIAPYSLYEMRVISIKDKGQEHKLV